MQVHVTPTKEPQDNQKMKDKELPLMTYEKWYNVITDDDVEECKRVLGNLKNEAEIDRHLNGHFVYPASPGKKQRQTQICRPFVLAASLASANVVRVMLGYDVLDVAITEEDGCNVLHGLVVTSVMFRDQSEAVLDLWSVLRERLAPEVLQQLLLAENSAGLRPVEFAAQQGTFDLMHRYFEHTHLVERRKSGIHEHVIYDVEEYEFDMPHGRRHLSPMHFLADVDRDVIGDVSGTRHVRSGPMAVWLRCKWKSHLISYILWFLLRLAHICLYFVLENDLEALIQYGGVPHTSHPDVLRNATVVFCEEFSFIRLSGETRDALSVLLGVLGVIVLAFYTRRALLSQFHPKYRNQLHYLPRKRRLVKHFLFYDACAVLFSAFSVVYVILASTHATEGIPANVGDYIRMLMTGAAIFSIFYFIQVLPIFGPFIITINRMLGALLKFGVVFTMMQIPFVSLMAIVSNWQSRSCVQDFSSFGRSYFSVFRMMLNMVNFQAYDLRDPHVFDVLHMLYVFLIAILLLNFLIAVMANSVTEVEENRDLIVNIQRLDLIRHMEETTSWWPALHRRVIQRHFLSARGRLCILLTRSIKQ